MACAASTSKAASLFKTPSASRLASPASLFSRAASVDWVVAVWTAFVFKPSEPANSAGDFEAEDF